MIKKYGKNVLVVSDDELAYYIEGLKHPLFFHPGSTMFRVKRFLKGGFDPFLDATKLQPGMSILDCTMGMGTDAILSSFNSWFKRKGYGIREKSFAFLYCTRRVQAFSIRFKSKIAGGYAVD